MARLTSAVIYQSEINKFSSSKAITQHVKLFSFNFQWRQDHEGVRCVSFVRHF